MTIHEYTPVCELSRDGSLICLATPKSDILARQISPAKNSANPKLRSSRTSFIPIYDYSFATELLATDQWASIGGTGRHGIADSGTQFHYFRKTPDDRMLWAGCDAVYPFGSDLSDGLLQRPESFQRLAGLFASTFPTSSDVRFDHAWVAVIDISARTTFFSGLAFREHVAYAMGFTGQGVLASRFAALTMLDRLAGAVTKRTRLRMPHRWPVPFPQEPLRSGKVKKARKDLAQVDATRKRSRFLRLLDCFGVGFDSQGVSPGRPLPNRDYFLASRGNCGGVTGT